MRNKEFRLEPLLKYKTFMEETMMHELADIAEILAVEEQRLFALEEIWMHAIEDLKERQGRQVPPHEIFMYHAYLQQMSVDLETQRTKVVEARNAYDAKRESLAVAARERKAVDKVRQKKADRESVKAKKEDKKSMDETANNKYLRENC